MAKTEKDKKIGLERGQRVRGLREALRYSRQKFCDTYQINPSTLHSWEAVRWNGLSERGARQLVEAFRREEIDVSIEWLMYGIGENPLNSAIQARLAKSLAPVTREENIAQELKLFHQLNPDAVDAVVSDDGLAPCLIKGDRVAGQRYFDNKIEQAIGYNCIVQTLSGQVLVRQLKAGSDIELYSLMCTNPVTTVTEPYIEDVKLFSAAPILWIRKQTRSGVVALEI